MIKFASPPEMKNKAESYERITLIREAEYFYQKIFSTAPPLSIKEKYREANLALIKEQSEKIKLLVFKKADIEAIEYAWRRKSPDNSLTRKIHILIYLAETTRENFDRFYNLKTRKTQTWFMLCLYSLRATYKFLKGKILLKRYKLV